MKPLNSPQPNEETDERVVDREIWREGQFEISQSLERSIASYARD
jgi:hypothetical protein